MGNCSPKPKNGTRSPAAAAAKPGPIVRLYGKESCPIAWRIRVALLYKSVAVQFFPTDGPVFLRCGGEAVEGPADSLLRYIDSKFPRPPVVAVERGTAAGKAALVTALQHRSVERHVEVMVRWAAELVAGGRGGGRMEARKVGRSYGQLVEVMLEHAQMEERLLFPALEAAADRGVCKVANEEHARDLPIMNGINEDIKSLVAMDAGAPCYQEALLNLSLRFKTLQEHCKEHFKEEEKELLPLLEAAERTRIGEENDTSSSFAEQVMLLMESTHSHLFPFFMAGLLPHEAMQYVDLVCLCTCDQQRVVAMLKSLTTLIDGTHPPSICNIPLKSL
ncbi:uncharacterized protein LOC103718891 [Phoenix dactylifera]|uniref:Uncharacterized protein LOC103718891 n=1 Tax=Phoenix dactylifera TaxID=42345 RepID=A0A8B7CTM5_PHODC|nr:uncharacterized protein LOC103718891 [Phoenix dactylifera]